MSKFFVRCSLTSVVLCALGLLPTSAETQRDPSSADARLRTLYTEEWNWRRQEMARTSDEPGEAGASDHFPQALAYKLGELQIRRHRRDAEEGLGSKFDQRQFHDAILGLGSVPLPVLDERMTRFIADGGVNRR
jgi:hypothetical protein